MTIPQCRVAHKDMIIPRYRVAHKVMITPCRVAHRVMSFLGPLL